jgi:hypothetical protein
MPALVGNISVAHDTALTTDVTQATVYRTAMATHAQLGATSLPSPFTAHPPDSLGFASATARTLARSPRLQSRRAHDGDAIALDR